MYFFPAAPSAAPTSVSASIQTPFDINVQWEPLECIHRNGDITGYRVRYEVLESGTPTLWYTSYTETVIRNLRASTDYSIEVAAINNAGTGVYSPILLKRMHGSEFISNCERAVYSYLILQVSTSV